jgi:adenylate kinase family enzyme
MKTAYIFYGRSGSGKGTQAKLLIEALQTSGKTVQFVETGKLARDVAATGSYVGNKIGETMEHGELLPPFIPVYLWARELVQNLNADDDVVLDGVARRAEEIPLLASALIYCGFETAYVIHLDVSIGWATERLLSRARSDDDRNSIAHRMAWYETDVAPAIAATRGRAPFSYVRIDGEQDIESVHAEVMEKIS